MVGVYQRLNLLLCKEGRFGCGLSKIVKLMSLFIYYSHGKNQEKHALFDEQKNKSSNLLIKKRKPSLNQPQVLSLTWKISLCFCYFTPF